MCEYVARVDHPSQDRATHRKSLVVLAVSKYNPLSVYVKTTEIESLRNDECHHILRDAMIGLAYDEIKYNTYEPLRIVCR